MACPREPACWPGWQWVEAADIEAFTASAQDVLAEVGRGHGLTPLGGLVGSTAVPVGVCEARGLRVPVVWLRSEGGAFEAECTALRARLGADGLIVLVSLPRGVTPRVQGDRIAIVELPASEDLQLWRALDLLDPTYRQRRLTDGDAIFDDVLIEFATVPTQHHVVRINGCESDCFRKSDVKFTRLLFLAAARKLDPRSDGGWVKKSKLLDDDKDHETNRLRDELARYKHPELTAQELRELVKTSPRKDGTVRLAVRPEAIVFDASLADFQCIGEQQATPKSGKAQKTPGQKQLAENLEAGRQTAQSLLDAARRLGVPSPAR